MVEGKIARLLHWLCF